jgi:purine-cytosine permease-like protein
MGVTLPVFAVLLTGAIIRNGAHDGLVPFLQYPIIGGHDLAVTATGVFATVGVLTVFLVNATVAADVGRFLPESKRRAGAVVLGVALQPVSFFGAALLGAWLTYRFEDGPDPGRYLVHILDFWGFLYVIISQVRINVINLYAGSLSLSNFVARTLAFRPGRHVWVATMAGIGTTLAVMGVYKELLSVLTFGATFVSAWVMALVSYILRHRLLSVPLDNGNNLLSAKRVDWEGTTALIAALVVAGPFIFGAAGAIGKSIAPLISGAVAALTVPIMCVAIHGRTTVRPHASRLFQSRTPDEGHDISHR